MLPQALLELSSRQESPGCALSNEEGAGESNHLGMESFFERGLRPQIALLAQLL